MVVMLPGMGMRDSKSFQDFVSECCDISVGCSASWLQKVFPKAPLRETKRDAPADRWFDMVSNPVMPEEVHEGLWEAVADLHKIFAQAEAEGIWSTRIVAGGFSQGAVVALVAALTYKKPIGGVCMFSGWLPAGVLKDARHWDTPILMCHGANDSLIPVSTGEKSAQLLRDAGARRINFVIDANRKHECGTPRQKSSLAHFLDDKIQMVCAKEVREVAMTESTYAESTFAGSEISVSQEEEEDNAEAETCQKHTCVCQ
jgi:predicted esterase